MLVLTVGSSARGRPVSFVGSTMVMSNNQPFMVTLSADHTPLRWASFGLNYQWLNRVDGAAEIFTAEANFLAFRWNASDWQANAFLTGNLGGLRHLGLNAAAVSGAAEADIESRRWYLLASSRWIHSLQGYTDVQAMARAGLAPFKAEFDQINPWVVIQYQYMPRFARQQVITAMLRLLYQGVLFEIGSSLRGEWLVNFSAEL